MKMKFAVKKGKIVQIKKEIIPKKNDAYTSYVNYALGTHHLDKNKLLTRSQFNTALAAEKAKGRKTSGRYIAELQAHEGYTNKEIRARWHATQLKDSSLTKKEFIATGKYKDLDVMAENLYARLKKEHPGLTSKQYSLIISQEIYGSE